VRLRAKLLLAVIPRKLAALRQVDYRRRVARAVVRRSSTAP
jgi:hypothetical protein